MAICRWVSVVGLLWCLSLGLHASVGGAEPRQPAPEPMVAQVSLLEGLTPETMVKVRRLAELLLAGCGKTAFDP